MAFYRFYSLDSSGHICDREERECADDRNAVAEGRLIAARLKKPIEIWEAARSLGLVRDDGGEAAAVIA